MDKHWLRSMFGLILVSLFGFLLAARSPRDPRWVKGNTHCHTLWSDGDAAPEVAVDWYKSHGYQFLVLSDHNIMQEGEKVRKINGQPVRLQTLPELRKTFEEEEKFLLVPGEEITGEFNRKPIHHNLLNNQRVLTSPTGKSMREVLEKTVKAYEEEAKACGRPVLLHLNHPNYGWAVEPDDLAYVLGERFFEVYNGHRGTRTYGDKTHKSCEQLWDYVLAIRLGKLGGEPLYALATDDAHEYHKEQAVSRPGRGWVMVRSGELTADAITRAMLAGDFYASSGVTLESVAADKVGMTVKVAAEAGVSYAVRFVGTRVDGEVGQVLQESKGAEATYAFKGDELYVRATVVSSRKHPNGYSADDFETAWAQPVVVRKLAKAAEPKGLDVAIRAGLDFLRARVTKQSAAAEKERELLLYTLVQAGVRKGDPVYDELLKAMLEAPLATTYKVSLQAMALERIDPEAHRKRIFQCAQFLVDNQCRNGQWSYGEPTTYVEPSSAEPKPAVKKQRDGPDHGDNSNAQYAALGLRACHDAGIVLPKEVIQRAAQWWRDSVHGSPPAKAEASAVEARGWNYGPKGNPPYGSMTAGAAGALAILDVQMGVFWRKDEVVNAGMNWLRDNYSVAENPGRHAQHLYYYLYALERAATLYGTDKLGKADWYADGSKLLLGRQEADGSWEKNAVDTCFAILFLKRATKPLVEPMDLDRKK